MKTITVRGTGHVAVKPDLIVVSMRMRTSDKKYDKTMEYAAERIKLIDDALREIGFEKDSVKTTDFNVSTDYKSVKDKNDNYKRVFLGYVCEHKLKVEFNFDTKRLAEVLTAISECFADPEFSIAFTVKDPSAISGALLKSAAQNAKEKAEVLCEASGVKLGELTRINYSWSELNIYSDTNYAMDEVCLMKPKSSCLEDIDIRPDDINVNDSATFEWEIL